jgi:hypothetical protein
MPAKLTTRDFIARAKTKHGTRYDYSLVEYVHTHTKVQIICPDHGVFEQTPNGHLNGRGCHICSDAKLDNKTFIKKATEKHNDKYDYSLVHYVKSQTKVKIVCSEHGVFLQAPAKHLWGRGCPRCCDNVKLDNVAFIKRAKLTHGSRYDYSLVDYVNNHIKVKIVCRKHGQFEQSPRDHVSGQNCPLCSATATLDNKTFIKKATEKHNGKYDYSLVDYVRGHNKVRIVCAEHGQFRQTPANHLRGQGCPVCARTGYDPSKPGRLYYVMFDFGHTILYKIGITNKTVKQRFCSEKVKPIVLWESTFSDGRIAQKVEADKKKEYSEYLYKGVPLLKCGNTECFTVDIMSFGRSTRVPLSV